MIWAALGFLSLLIGDRADNTVGRNALWVLGMFLFVAGLFSAPWHEAFA